MILIKPIKIREWLKSIEKNQKWLSEELHVRKSYLSQILHNRCKISRQIIEGFMSISHIAFDALFYMDKEIDTREFFGRSMTFHGKYMESPEYNKEIDKILASKNGNGHPVI